MSKCGVITGFSSSYSSGIATIYINKEPVLCENTPTVRALDDCFGDVISSDHSVDVEAIIGREICYEVDSLNILEWFAPIG
jgi:hypothetical protein